jgi:hypothetical protein
MKTRAFRLPTCASIFWVGEILCGKVLSYYQHLHKATPGKWVNLHQAAKANSQFILNFIVTNMRSIQLAAFHLLLVSNCACK